MTALLPPCLVDPISWDLDPDVGAPHIPVDQMTWACLTQCPRLERCRAENQTDERFGVVAGEYRPWPGTLTRLDEIERKPVLRRVVAAIRTEAEALDFGDELPTSVNLAAQIGVSRHAVRAALHWLAEEDVLLKPATHAGRYRVAPPRKEHAA